MTELSKYIGPVVDLPGQGSGVTANEIGLVCKSAILLVIYI